MKAIVLDNLFRYKEEFNGRNVKGVFKYKENPWAFWKKEKELEFDYDKIIPFKNEKIAIYQFDGKDYRQMSLSEMPKDQSSFIDYVNNFKIMELHKQLGLKKPFSLKDLVEILFFILALVIIVSIYFVYHNAIVNLNNTVKPFSNISAENIKLQEENYNLTQQNIKIFNATLFYLKTHGG